MMNTKIMKVMDMKEEVIKKQKKVTEKEKI